MAAPESRPAVWPAVARGARRRCPHCGQGPLFVRWITTRERCPACGLVYIRNQGDTWLFWILTDRVPLLLGIAAIYLGFRVSDWMTGLSFFLAMAVPLVATMPCRQGVAIALSYLSRVYFRDPSDILPGSPSEDTVPPEQYTRQDPPQARRRPPDDGATP